jgi:hypothetical protein
MHLTKTRYSKNVAVASWLFSAQKNAKRRLGKLINLTVDRSKIKSFPSLLAASEFLDLVDTMRICSESEEFLKTYNRWRKKPTNKTWQKRFVQSCKTLEKKYDVHAVGCAIEARFENTEEKLKFYDFILTYLSEAKQDNALVLYRVLENITKYAMRGLNERLQLLRKDLVHRVLNAWINSESPVLRSGVLFQIYQLWGSMKLLKETRNRVKQFENAKMCDVILKFNEDVMGRSDFGRVWDEFKKIHNVSNEVEDEVECTRCLGCNALDKDKIFKKCGRCKLAFFCSKECQKKTWKTHKFDCRPVKD